MKTLPALLLLFAVQLSMAQQKTEAGTQPITNSDITYVTDSTLTGIDTIATVNLRDVNVVYFKTKEDWITYVKYKSRIQKVMPYVKIANQLYNELKTEKENDNRRGYRHYRKDVEKEMRTKFEKELKDLTTSQGEMLFKLLNRETGNNAYFIIKEIKGGVTAWFYQQIGKRYGYDLKETYDPEKEKMIELIIRELGPAYNVKS
ncbi:MAG TPA: DUF4294 domain-containing protein [Chitinophagales bacterium]|nr:DUF4294 domain-containing protein [Chitinophagales bacterium]